MADSNQPIWFYRFLWVGALVGIAIEALSTALLLLNGPTGSAADTNGGQVITYLWKLISSPVTIATGLLVARRIPGNIVAPALVLWGVQCGLWMPNIEEPTLLALVSIFTLGFGVPGALILFVYFPDGRPSPSRAGRSYLAFFVINLLMSILFVCSHETYYNAAVVLSRPHGLYIPAFASLSGVTDLWLQVVYFPIWLLLPVPMFLRYRNAGWRQRQQIKVFLWLLAITVPMSAVIIFSASTSPDSSPLFGGLLRWLSYGFYTYAQLFPAVAIALAILRHKLWDIDVIIRRTLVYSVLTALLALIYWGGVAGLQSLLRPLIGGGNDLAVVATTLAVAGIFFPLRRLIQQFIDKRFYRRKYDTAQTLAQFGQVVRDEVDLDALTGRLLDVVDETMQPSQISIWLRPIGGKRDNQTT